MNKRQRFFITLGILVLDWGVAMAVTGQTGSGFSFSKAWNYEPGFIASVWAYAGGIIAALVFTPVIIRKI